MIKIYYIYLFQIKNINGFLINILIYILIKFNKKYKLCLIFSLEWYSSFH